MPVPTRQRNDLGQYDDLAGEWWRPDGVFAMLHWIARARAKLIPPAAPGGGLLIDLGCGGGLLAPYVAEKGYRHVGVDLTASALVHAAEHGVTAVRADVIRLPVRDGCADVVTAGELFEHVTDLSGAVAEACRIVRPGGLLVVDTINATLLARILAVGIAERVPGAAVRGIHDPNLFVRPRVLIDECAKHGVMLQVRGVRPRPLQSVRWLLRRRGAVEMVPTWSTAVLYQGIGMRTTE